MKSFFLSIKNFQFFRGVDKINFEPIPLQELGRKCWLKTRICEASINETYTYLVQAIKTELLIEELQQSSFAFYQSVAIINPLLEEALPAVLERIIDEANKRPHFVNETGILSVDDTNQFASAYLKAYFNFTRESTNYNRIAKYLPLNCSPDWPKLTNQYFEIIDWCSQILKQGPSDLQNFDITLVLVVTPVERLELTDTDYLEKPFEISCRVISLSKIQSLSATNPIIFMQRTLILKEFSLEAIYHFLCTIFDDASYQSYAFSALSDLEVYFHIPLDCKQLLLDWDMNW